MYSKEALITKDSQYFVYLPSTTAARVYLYPEIVGIFRYEKGYYLRRSHYDNYLLMYINKGELTLVFDGKQQKVREGQVVLLDCHEPHEYGNLSDSVLEIYWLHFKGVLAEEFYRLIRENNGNVISPQNPYPFSHHLRRIYELFLTSTPIHEADVSRRITAMLSEIVSVRSEHNGISESAEIIENSLAYINEHFREDITLDEMAARASLSPYYFTRLFCAETGFTPHQYLIAARINFAKYLLQSGEAPVKEIAFYSGFHSESGFCSTFRKREGMTPSEFRNKVRPQ